MQSARHSWSRTQLFGLCLPVLLLAILRPADSCKSKVNGISKVSVHYVASVWGAETPFEDTRPSGKPKKFKMGKAKSRTLLSDIS